MSTQAPARSWWQRNWKWCVPLAGAGLLAVFALAMFGMFSLLFGLLANSAPYQHAIERARDSTAVVAALGEPIEAGFMTQGHLRTADDEGEADLRIPLDGPRANASLHVEATREKGRWTYQTLDVVLADGSTIDLREPDDDVTTAPEPRYRKTPHERP
ncbi:cytochrome c oxidase assembly factor Coa1 family protein [Marilutibacter aestuarii]|uniref:Cytochrome oxidase complex assembly protein 1 n=1 Tax=Marilutibacter aestuarii TaxID=1706195 RepID=A0A507ZN59_9GAMM|nr:cytochrome c oxidase assembly factor Coa1 family protein [Lysobacter aestuarii]TQD38719.1 hypothetical protein FKV25_15945 [Lysobacter aestuarii]